MSEEETGPSAGAEELKESAPESEQLPAGESEGDPRDAKLAELEQALATCKDQLLRRAAEFDNYKKRSENESLTLIRFANEELITKLLPVIDDFERSIKAGIASNDESPDQAAFLRGVELIYNKLKKVLEANGVKEFEVLGKPFDPNLHDALLQVPKPGVPPHTVVEEVEKGYLMNDRVIRHARVIVSSDAPADAGLPSDPHS